MSTSLKRFFLVLFCGALLAAASWSCFQVYKLSSARAEIKLDYSEINSLSYSLLSVNVWRDHLTNIVINRVNDFELSQKQADTLEYEVSQILNGVVNKADSMVDLKQTSLKGKLTKFAIRTFVNEDKVRALVPVFAQTIVKEIQKPESKETLKYVVRSKVEEYSASTHANSPELLVVDSLLDKYQVADLEEFNKKSSITLFSLQEQTYYYTYISLGVVLMFLLLWWLFRNTKSLHTPLFILSVLLALVILAAGITAPMIEIDARFKEVNFLLVGESISFEDQVIFFQSKSIVDVVRILLETGAIDSIIVGGLILIFSIVFPIAKLLSTQVYLVGSNRFRSNKLINFFAFKSGKWSMADVYVIAIFMAYVGFQGILDHQLAILNVSNESLVSISTNETSLQPGFLLFIGFVLFSLLLSVILQRITKLEKKRKAKEIA